MATNHPIALKLSHLSLAVGIALAVVLAAIGAELGQSFEELPIVAGGPIIFAGAFVSALVLQRTEWTILGVGILFVFAAAYLEISATSHGEPVYGVFSMAGFAVMIASKPLVLRQGAINTGGTMAMSAVIVAVAAFDVLTGEGVSIVAKWIAFPGIIALLAWPVLALAVWVVRLLFGHPSLGR